LFHHMPFFSPFWLYIIYNSKDEQLQVLYRLNILENKLFFGFSLYTCTWPLESM
jgi:hypothetical protein